MAVCKYVSLSGASRRLWAKGHKRAKRAPRISGKKRDDLDHSDKKLWNAHSFFFSFRVDEELLVP